MEKPYITSDTAFAAYCCLHGFTLLGAVAESGNWRKDLYLVDPENGEDALARILKLREQFDVEHNGPKDYYAKLRMCLRAINNPISREMVER